MDDTATMMIMIRMTDEWEDGRRGCTCTPAGLPNLEQKKEEADRKQQHKEGLNE